MALALPLESDATFEHIPIINTRRCLLERKGKTEGDKLTNIRCVDEAHENKLDMNLMWCKI